MKISAETQVGIARIKAASIHYENLSSMHADIFASGNWWDEEIMTGGWVPDPDLDLITAISNDARLYLNAVLDDVRITEDLPEPVMLTILNRRLNTTHEQHWCDRVVALGGPRIGALWLREYVVNRRIKPQHRRCDPRIHAAAVLSDRDRVVSEPKISVPDYSLGA